MYWVLVSGREGLSFLFCKELFGLSDDSLTTMRRQELMYPVDSLEKCSFGSVHPFGAPQSTSSCAHTLRPTTDSQPLPSQHGQGDESRTKAPRTGHPQHRQGSRLSVGVGPGWCLWGESHNSTDRVGSIGRRYLRLWCVVLSTGE